VLTYRTVKRRDQPPFYHRKVSGRGGTRSMSVGRILPSDWLIVRVQVVKLEGGVCILQITKLD